MIEEKLKLFEVKASSLIDEINALKKKAHALIGTS